MYTSDESATVDAAVAKTLTTTGDDDTSVVDSGTAVYYSSWASYYDYTVYTSGNGGETTPPV